MNKQIISIAIAGTLLAGNVVAGEVVSSDIVGGPVGIPMATTVSGEVAIAHSPWFDAPVRQVAGTSIPILIRG